MRMEALYRGCFSCAECAPCNRRKKSTIELTIYEQQAAPPKTKYIEHILIATHAGEAGVGEVFRALQNRLRDSTWTVVFKSLITVHLMIREGSPDVTLSYLARHRSMLAISMFSDGEEYYEQYALRKSSPRLGG